VTADGRGSTDALKRLLAPDRDPVPAAEASASPAAVLRRFMQPKQKAAPGEACEFCMEALAAEHSHVADVEMRSVKCSCRGCYLLFSSDGAAGGRYRAIPEGAVYDPSFVLTAVQWDALQVPVGICFFFRNSSLGTTVAFYPGPAGATESLLPLDVWDELSEANPTLQQMLPDVQALLVRRLGHGSECYVVPIDACYELVGIIRRTWKGFDGGEEAHTAIDRFFSQLRERSQWRGAGRA